MVWCTDVTNVNYNLCLQLFWIVTNLEHTQWSSSSANCVPKLSRKAHFSIKVWHTAFKRRTINVDYVIKFKLPIYLRVHQKKIHKSEIEQELHSNGSEEPLNFKWWLRFEILDRIAAVKSQRLHLMVSKMIIRRLLILRRVIVHSIECNDPL